MKHSSFYLKSLKIKFLIINIILQLQSFLLPIVANVNTGYCHSGSNHFFQKYISEHVHWDWKLVNIEKMAATLIARRLTLNRNSFSKILKRNRYIVLCVHIYRHFCSYRLYFSKHYWFSRWNDFFFNFNWQLIIFLITISCGNFSQVFIE